MFCSSVQCWNGGVTVRVVVIMSYIISALIIVFFLSCSCIVLLCAAVLLQILFLDSLAEERGVMGR